MATRRRRVKATTPQRAQAAGFPRKKLKEAPPAPAAPPVLVEVGGWSLNTAQYRRFLRLQSRMQLRGASGRDFFFCARVRPLGVRRAL